MGRRREAVQEGRLALHRLGKNRAGPPKDLRRPTAAKESKTGLNCGSWAKLGAVAPGTADDQRVTEDVPSKITPLADCPEEIIAGLRHELEQRFPHVPQE